MENLCKQAFIDEHKRKAESITKSESEIWRFFCRTNYNTNMKYREFLFIHDWQAILSPMVENKSALLTLVRTNQFNCFKIFY